MIVLSIVLNPRYVGQAVLDTFGVLDRGFRTHSVRTREGNIARNALLKRLVALSLRRYRPSLVIVARSVHPRATSCVGMQGSMLQMLRRKNTPYILRTTFHARLFFLGRYRQKRRDEIAILLTSGFFPSLKEEVHRFGDSERYRRQSWWALSLALIEVARQHSDAVRALVQPDGRLSTNLVQLMTEGMRTN